MASRVIRDGLLDSETVSALHDATFRLYIHLLLAADDYGLVAIGFGPIKRAAPLLDWNRELVAKMLLELTDAGLIIPYEDCDKQFAAIARWKSNINSLSPKYPVPPFGMSHIIGVYKFKSQTVRDAAEKIININKDKSFPSDTPAPRQSVASPAPVCGSGKREEVKDIRPNKYSDEDFSFGEKMLESILDIHPSFKKPNLAKWANEIRLIREKDQRSLEDLQKVFIWANADSFWRANILSPAKLRKQFDTIKIQMSSKGGAGQSAPTRNQFLGAV